MCPLCKKKLAEHSELQDKICEMITIKQFADDSPGFDIQFRPFFEEDKPIIHLDICFLLAVKCLDL